MSTKHGPDFEVRGSGTVYLLVPQNESAWGWVDDNLPSDVQHFGGGIAIEHRYIDSIVEGAQADGYTVLEA